MTSPVLPAWCKAFVHVSWSEHCVILSNSPNTVVPPIGTGLDDDGEDRPFHLSLMRHRIWGRDDFWYLGLLPRLLSFREDPVFESLSVPFEFLPINGASDGRWRLSPHTIARWLTLEWHVVATYNVLKDKYAGLVPLRTKLPPCPRSTRFYTYHDTEDEARRACHRARRFFWPWLSLLTMLIARSAPAEGSGPSEWFRVLAESGVAFEPFWLDGIAMSRIVTCMDHTLPRRGLVVNMHADWKFLHGFPLLHWVATPVWLCFPHGAVYRSFLARSLQPSRAAIEKSRCNKEPIPIDYVLNRPPLPDSRSQATFAGHCVDYSVVIDEGTSIALGNFVDETIELDDDAPIPRADLDAVLNPSPELLARRGPEEKLAELAYLRFTVDLLDPFIDILKYRYGMVLTVPMQHSSPSPIAGGQSKALLQCLRGMVLEKALDDHQWEDPAIIAVLEAFSSTIMAGKVVPRHVSDCHVEDSLFLSLNDVWKVQPYQVGTCEAGIGLYAVRTHDCVALRWIIVVKGLVTARELLRRRWGPLNAQIVKHLVDRGVPFLLGCLTPPPVTIAPASYVSDIFRPEGYVFGVHDYQSYVRRRLELFKDWAVAQPAMREGGILWRLAMESDVDVDVCLSVDGRRDVYQLEALGQGNTQWSVVALPDAIADSLIGMYKLYTGENLLACVIKLI